MGELSLFFLDRIKLLDKFFGNSSFHQLIMNDVEIGALDVLMRKGFLNRKKIRNYIKKGIIVPQSGKYSVPELSTTRISPNRIIEKISTYYHKNNNDFVMVEDDILRSGLKKKGVNILTVPDVIFFLAERKDITKSEAIEALEWCKIFKWYNQSVLDFIVREVKKLG